MSASVTTGREEALGCDDDADDAGDAGDAEAGEDEEGGGAEEDAKRVKEDAGQMRAGGSRSAARASGAMKDNADEGMDIARRTVGWR